MFRYKYSILLAVTFIFAWLLGHFGHVDSLLNSATSLNALVYAALSGAMYSFSFTAPFAVLLFSNLSIPMESVFVFSLVAATGGLLSDILIFRFIKDVFFNEIGEKTKKIIARATKTRATKTLLSVVGAIIIASPFPDELGIAFMGLSKMSFWKLVGLTFCLDALGCYLLITAVSTIV